MNGSAAASKVLPDYEAPQECCAWQDLILCRIDTLCRMDTSDCDLITLTEVSELGLTYTYKADAVKGKRWANLRSLECGELNAFSVPGDLENSETEAECCYRSKIETKKRHKEGAWADRGGTRFGG